MECLQAPPYPTCFAHGVTLFARWIFFFRPRWEPVRRLISWCLLSFQLAGILAPGPWCSASSHCGTHQPSGTFDLSTLEQQCYSFLIKGLAPSTRRSYASAQAQFLSFCTQLGKLHSSGSPCPVDEWTLCLFATFLATRIQHSSIKVYLSGVRALHIEQGFPDPLANCLCLQRVVRGIKHSQGSSSSLHLPIDGFHVTQISLIITQVKNKIVYYSIYQVKKLKYRRRVIN